MSIQTRELTATARPIPDYLAWPEGAGPFPGVVVIHEMYGLTENIESLSIGDVFTAQPPRQDGRVAYNRCSQEPDLYSKRQIENGRITQ